MNREEFMKTMSETLIRPREERAKKDASPIRCKR